MTGRHGVQATHPHPPTPGGYPWLTQGLVSHPTTEKTKKALYIHSDAWYNKGEKEQAVEQNDPLRSVKNDVKTF